MQNQNRLLRKIIIWGGGVILLVLMFLGMTKFSGQIQSPIGKLVVPVSAGDNMQGPANAPIVLVEYSDFQCPACAAFHAVLKKLIADSELAPKMKFVYRYFPLKTIHDHAMLSAQAAQAAALQGKFWEMSDLLFEHQTAWASQSDTAARATFAGYARQLRLDMEKYAADLDSKAVKDRVEADYRSGIDSDVESTPSFFVNGIAIPHPSSYDQLKQLILTTHAN